MGKDRATLEGANDPQLADDTAQHTEAELVTLTSSMDAKINKLIN